MAITTTLVYRVTNIAESGDDRVLVNLVQVQDESNPSGVVYQNPLSLNLSTEDGKAYWPGQQFKVALSPVAA